MSSNKILNRSAAIVSQLIKSKTTSFATMATAATVSLTPTTTGVMHAPQITPESCTRASQLLQKNHDDHHMYFNTDGFHNHIAHHLLTIFALGANPSQIQSAFDDNANYQRPQFPVTKNTVESMKSPSDFRTYLGKEKYFHDYEIFFSKEIEAANGSWQSVLNKHLFDSSPQAQDLLYRMYDGLYHPIIHLGFGIEFDQPAIIVEALAQAATHTTRMSAFLSSTEELARKNLADNKPSRPLIDLINEARANDKIRTSTRWEDRIKLREGVLARAGPELAALCSQFVVRPDAKDLRAKTAEMINTSCFFAAGAQHPSHAKQIKYDFFYIHCTNLSVFFSAFIRPENDSWLSNETRAKLLMWKAWMDVAVYVSRGAPELFADEITGYKPKQPHDGWKEIFARVDALPDDGHASKLVRTLANGERACAEFEGKEESKSWPVKGDMWLKMGHMAIDSVEGVSSKWVRSCGFDEAWKDIPGRDERREELQSRSEAVQSYYEKVQGYSNSDF